MTKETKTLLLIDANALIHRSYHALPPLTTREGVVVHAVYGFASVLLKVLDAVKPDYVAAAFDLPAPTFRDDLYEEYKAHRPKTPDDLLEQMPLVRELLSTFGIPVVENEGFEADDIIGTIAEQFRSKKDLSTIIVTGDLDTLQLVGDNVSVYTLRRGMTDTTMYAESDVEKRYGVTPKELPDHKGLMGDPSDNIPGVPGVGQKTATVLLREFGSMDALYEALEKNPDDSRVKPAVRTKLLHHKKLALMSRELATIRRDAPVALSLKDAKQAPLHRDEAADFFRRLGFTSLLRRLPPDINARRKKENNGITHANNQPVLTRTAEVSSFLRNDPTGLFPEWEILGRDRNLRGLRLQMRDGREAVVRPYGSWREMFSVFVDASVRFVIHNAKPLWKFALREGAPIPSFVHDTMVAAYLEYPQEGEQALNDLMMVDGVETIVDLADRQLQRLKDVDLLLLFEEVEIPLISVLAAMEVRGIAVDVKRLEAVGRTARKHLEGLERSIHHKVGISFTINSPQQLSDVLFDRLGISSKGLKKTSTGMISTAESELVKIQNEHPVVPLVLEYRTFSKAISTYIEPIPEALHLGTKRIHTTFHQAVTATGRLSSSNPNLQNIPVRGELAGEIRSAFVPAKGKLFLAFDYSQIELRVAAVVAKDRNMLDAFAEGEDIHARTAAEIFSITQKNVSKDQRRFAKVLNFGVLYGMSAHGFSQAAGVTREEAQEFIDRYMKEFSGIAQYIQQTEQEAKEKGFVKTLLGRRRPTPDIRSSNFQVREAARRMAINMPLQGMAADLLKIAMVRIDSALRDAGIEDDALLLLQIHDELLFEINPKKQEEIVRLVRDTMEGVRIDRLLTDRGVIFPISIDVDVAVGSSWGSLKRIAI